MLTIPFGKSPRQGGPPTERLLNLHRPRGEVYQTRTIILISRLKRPPGNGTIDGPPCRHQMSLTEVPHPAPLVRHTRAIATTRPTGKLIRRGVTGMARDPAG